MYTHVACKQKKSNDRIKEETVNYVKNSYKNELKK